MMKKCLMVCLFVMIVFAAFAKSEMITAEVVGIIDGNTLRVKTVDEELVIQLAGIDSPELGQTFGDEAKNFLTKKILHKKVSIQLHGKDKRGNRLAVVLIKGSVDIRVELLEAGLAWTSEREPIDELEKIRSRAQANGKGLWEEPTPTPPWIYRRQQSMQEAKGS